jgi:release factor glutamine methyltransferase
MTGGIDRDAVVSALACAGCVAAEDEADELTTAAPDQATLRRMLTRRTTGEPLAWITGRTTFCGRSLIVDPGVYVPRWQSSPLARRASRHLPREGIGVDLGTGSGAVALVMMSARPRARVVGTEIDTRAAACARRNRVEVYRGSLYDPLPEELVARVDVVVGVLPYVPSGSLHLLPRDVTCFEPEVALDGGRDGLEVVGKAVRQGPRWLRSGGWLLLESGSDQVGPVADLMAQSGFSQLDVVRDGDGDVRGVVGRCR